VESIGTVGCKTRQKSDAEACENKESDEVPEKGSPFSKPNNQPAMKKLFLLSFLIFASLPASAGVLSFNKKVEICGIFAQANDMGLSGKAVLRQSLERRGEPGYLANVIYDDIKNVCPRAY